MNEKLKEEITKEAMKYVNELRGGVAFTTGCVWMHERVKPLIEVLELYANGKNWSEYGAGIYLDLGTTAKEALEKFYGEEK